MVDGRRKKEGLLHYQKSRLVYCSIQALDESLVQGIVPDVAVMQVWAPELGAQSTALQQPRWEGMKEGPVLQVNPNPQVRGVACRRVVR